VREGKGRENLVGYGIGAQVHGDLTQLVSMPSTLSAKRAVRGTALRRASVA